MINKIDGTPYLIQPNMKSSGSNNNGGAMPGLVKNTEQFSGTPKNIYKSTEPIDSQFLIEYFTSSDILSVNSIDITINTDEIKSIQSEIISNILSSSKIISNNITLNNNTLMMNNKQILSLKPNTTILNDIVGNIQWSIPIPVILSNINKPWKIISYV